MDVPPVPPLKGLNFNIAAYPALKRLLRNSVGVCVVAVPSLRGSVVFATSPRAYAPG
jgi:hypothetical protein